MEAQTLTLVEQAGTTAALAPPAPVAPAPVKPRLLLAAGASAVLLWACYFPLAFGWLAWVALVPLLCLIRSDARPMRILGAAWVGGLLFFGSAIWWMHVADYRMYFTWAMLATYCSLYFPLAVWLLRRLDRGTDLPLVLTLPVVWTGLEFVRSFLMTGFAWYFLGHTQHAFLPLIQVADLGGAYAVTFLVAAVNAWVFELAYTRPWFRRVLVLKADALSSSRRALGLQLAVLVVLVGGTLGYGCWRLDQELFAPGPRIALLQSNLDQRLRINAALNEGDKAVVRDTCRELCRVASRQQPRPDLIVWPETSFYGEWVDLEPSIPRDRLSRKVAEILEAEQKSVLDVGQENGVSVLLGLNSVILHREPPVTRYNTALLVRPDRQIGGRYDKMHRVPFGEYVPLRDWLPFMEQFAPYDFDYSIRPGDRLTRFALGNFHFGVLICYEDTDPVLARQYVVADDDGPPVDFLLNISNDGWFDGTSEHDEHLAICRFRAIESRRAVARAVNMGISAVIDGNGRVLAPKELWAGKPLNWWQVPTADAASLPVSDWSRFKQVQGVLTATIPIDHRVSLYARWGDWLGWGCVLGAILGLAWSLRRRQVVH